MAFVPNRPILNPHFEGYKLSFSPSPYLANVPLEHRATQSRVGTHPLGFQAVSSRVRHNHLAVGEPSDSALYIADDGGVVLVRMDDLNEANGSEMQSGVTIDVVFRLPAHHTLPRGQAEYPAAVHVTGDVWLVSDGHGYAYLLRMGSRSTGGTVAQLLATRQLRLDEATTPFQLRTAVLVSQGSALAVLSSSAPTTAPSPTATTPRDFDIWAVHVPIPESSIEIADLQSQSPVSFDIAWHCRGTDIPLFVKYDTTNNAFLFLGGSSYGDVAAPSTQNIYEPTPSELAPIPRLGETLETSAPPPYSWTQTDDTVTVALALPGATPKSNIAAIFKSTTLSLHVGNPPLFQPHYNAVPLWDAIHPASSLWTWERGELNKAGLLTLHLDKAHVGTRWSHVFAQGTEPEVPETLDPSELAGIRESLDKYTSALQEGASGLGHGVPSLATGERDNEVDSSIGSPVVLTWVGIDGSTPTSADGPAVLLSLPLPGTPGPLTLVMKHDIDGPLYTLHGAHAWSHTATFPALAFVLASKRDTRFTFHISSTLALAFESGAREGGGGNVYLYHGSAPGDKWAKQSVFQMRAGVGALLGIGMVTSITGRSSLLCLSERELTICQGLT